MVSKLKKTLCTLLTAGALWLGAGKAESATPLFGEVNARYHNPGLSLAAHLFYTPHPNIFLTVSGKYMDGLEGVFQHAPDDATLTARQSFASLLVGTNAGDPFSIGAYGFGVGLGARTEQSNLKINYHSDLHGENTEKRPVLPQASVFFNLDQILLRADGFYGTGDIHFGMGDSHASEKVSGYTIYLSRPPRGTSFTDRFTLHGQYTVTAINGGPRGRYHENGGTVTGGFAPIVSDHVTLTLEGGYESSSGNGPTSLAKNGFIGGLHVEF
ncbi:hypothetical protein HZB02_00525 [Candidatus Woesearchaeota archaeon]|nr:hypothetical protein [Candidatus Woesearchaeota archaeon]